MNPDFLLAHFNRISDAHDSVPHLRRFILELAVRGKLVDQEPTDEPASELLSRIQTEKARLSEEGKIKRHGPQRDISANEIGFHLPSNWVPTRIGDLLTVIRGASPRPKGDPKYFSADRTSYHWIKISDIRKHSRDRVLYDTDEFLTEAGMEKSVRLPKGTLVVTNSATIGVPIFLGFEGGCIHDGYLAFPYFPTSELSKDFFFVLFQTLQSYAAKKARGMAQLNLNTELVREFPLGLPPFAEQRRIMTKVDELMAMCDRLEATQRKGETCRDRLSAASHYHLTNGATAEVFRKHANFFLGHLPRLTIRPDQVKQLRQTILKLAVRGQLVPHDLNDEPASELLQRIHAWRKEAEGAKTVRSPRKPLQAVEESEPPYELPRGWEWARLGELIYIHSGDGLIAEAMRNGCVPVFGGNGIAGYHDTSNVSRPSIVIGRVGYYCGSIHITPAQAWVTDNAFITEFPADEIFLNFLVLLLRGTNLKENEKATAQPVISGSKVYPIVVGLPPLAEQRRIVARVDELMGICDLLEAQLTTAQTETSRLLESVLHQSLAEAS